MQRIGRFILAIWLAGLACAAAAQESAARWVQKELAYEGRTYPYTVYLPPGYTASRKWPVILFLHGAGERGNDGMKQNTVGLGPALQRYPERYPAVVVLPQCPTGERWSGAPAEAALRALERTVAEYQGDPDQLYLTGLSMGGFGSWYLAARYPDRFAAVVPICGGGDPAAAEKLKGLPIWIFHGDADNAVPVARSRDMLAAIWAAGGTRVWYTEYPGVGHNSWDRAYGEPELARWLFEQRRGR